MKDPNLSELVRTCIAGCIWFRRFLAFTCLTCLCGKNSIKASDDLAGIHWHQRHHSAGDTMEMKNWWGNSDDVCSVVIMIANTVLIYYTFEGSLPKVVLGAMLAGYRNVHDSLSGNLYCGSLSGRPLIS